MHPDGLPQKFSDFKQSRPGNDPDVEFLRNLSVRNVLQPSASAAGPSRPTYVLHMHHLRGPTRKWGALMRVCERTTPFSVDTHVRASPDIAHDARTARLREISRTRSEGGAVQSGGFH